MIVRSIKLREREIIIDSITLDFSVKNGLTICVVQIDYSLSKTFPYSLINKEEVKNKIIKALTVAEEEHVDIICFPELSIDKNFINELNTFDKMIIIGGTFYDENCFNVCPVIYKGIVYPIEKINPSPHYERDLSEWEKMKCGSKITVFESKDKTYKFVILICIDYLLESYEFRRREDKINLIFTPSLNPAKRKFQMTANQLCYVFHIDTVLANILENNHKYRGTCFFCFEHNLYLNGLSGYKKNDEFEFKIFEASGENLLILKLFNKSVEISTTPDSTPRIQILKRYLFLNDEWKDVNLKAFD